MCSVEICFKLRAVEGCENESETWPGSYLHGVYVPVGKER
jgi:hypothetical protein